jgi:Domain of unknown function (DUF4861)
MAPRRFLWAALLVVEVPLCCAARPAAAANWVLPNFAQRLDLTVTNPAGVPISTLVTLPVSAVRHTALDFPGSLAIAVAVNPPASEYSVTVIPSQADDLDGDGMPDEFEFPISLKPRESKQVEIYYSTTLHGKIFYPQLVHASHNYGYNHQTAALESELIGYRAYGGFFLDVEGRVAGHLGLYNDLNGYLAAVGHFAVGEDIFHIGDTLGLGGLFLERGGKIYQPPINIPDYAHKPSPEDVPRYRVVADGPIRATIEATLDHWQLGDDAVAVRARYSIDAGEGFVRCRVRVVSTKVRQGDAFQFGAGLRQLPAHKFLQRAGMLLLSGEQRPDTGRLALALYFNPATASSVPPVTTAEGKNQAIIFHPPLRRGRAIEEDYAIAAAWGRSGIPDLLGYLASMKDRVDAKVVVSGERLERTPWPERIEGEAY